VSRSRFRNQVVLVTGGAQGIGKEIATAFAAEHASVVIVDKDKEALDSCVCELSSSGLDVIGIEADLSHVDQIREATTTAVARRGRLNVLVNNAGGSAYTPLHIEEVTPEDFDRVVDWNLRSTFFGIQAALPFFRKEGGGAVVNIGAISGRAGTELLSPQYSAVKAGVIGLTRNLARHLGPENIRLNVVAPGFTRSGPRVEEIWMSRDPESVLKTIPLRRRATTSEVASAVLFLASNESSYITGATLDVNGGFLCL
jgi:NAD(P)-dependent dehydrogenase (short-subunit alcohol dehydrogenase family)